jgi:hypothetical protein
MMTEGRQTTTRMGLACTGFDYCQKVSNKIPSTN